MSNKPAAYIILDGEMGGIGLDKSLLTMYFRVTDKDFNLVDELYLYLKPNDNIYRVTGEAMSINKINLVEHDWKSVTYKEGGTALYNFLSKNSINIVGSIKLVPVGHGMNGDLDHIWDKLISRNTWETFISYRRLDTSVALQFLKACDLFPDTVSGSLDSLIQHFGIKVEGNLHDARTDTLCTLECLKKMIAHLDLLIGTGVDY
jgi:hypothetical protein